MSFIESKSIQVTGFCSQGDRTHMEDMFTMAYHQSKDNKKLEFAFFGIFDGHGGKEAAAFAKEELMKTIVVNPLFWSENDDDILHAIRLGFIHTHYNMRMSLDEWPKTAMGLPSTSGTTASVAFLRRSKIYVGHVGDSGIVLGQQEPNSSKWTGKQLTKDHKPECEEEYTRIRKNGGEVIYKRNGVARVVWQRPRMNHSKGSPTKNGIDVVPFLAVARSLGDFWSYNAVTDRFVVSPEPDVFVHKLDMSRDRCLIFGTDGLFNMLTPQQAAETVDEIIKNNGDKKYLKSGWQNPSQKLVEKALHCWSHSRSRADNTSALVVQLKPRKIPGSNSRSFHIENHTVKDNGQLKEPTESPKDGAVLWSYDVPVDKEDVPRMPVPITLSEMTLAFGCEAGPSTSSSDEDISKATEASSVEESMPSPLKEKRRDVRRLRRRRIYEVVPRSRRARRQSATLQQTTEEITQVARTRRTRSEEPARGESDSENVGGAPTRLLRSSMPVRTLRSRNVNLEPLARVLDESARGKRHKK